MISCFHLEIPIRITDLSKLSSFSSTCFKVFTWIWKILNSSFFSNIWYRNQTLEYDEFSTFTAMAGLNIPFNEQWRMKVMYSYEMNINSNQNFTGPSHEISLIFEFDDIGLIQKRSGGFMAPSSKRSNSPIECSPF